MKYILCYGDSNTHGVRPDAPGRYEFDIRWPGKLQELLGHNFKIIEDGLGGRTTDLDQNPEDEHRNGYKYFVACVEGHMPLDYIIIMLGTVDSKLTNNRTPENIVAALERYVDVVNDIFEYKRIHYMQTTKPKLLFVSPISIDPSKPRFNKFNAHKYDSTSVQKIAELSPLIKEMTKRRDARFLDAATIAGPGPDGTHMEMSGHSDLAKAIADLIE